MKKRPRITIKNKGEKVLVFSTSKLAKNGKNNISKSRDRSGIQC